MTTEEQIEIWVERQVDKLDALYMQGKIDEDTYRVEMNRINVQAEEFYAKT